MFEESVNDINIKKWVVPNKWVARWRDNKLDVQDLGGDWCLYVRSYGETIIGGRSDVFILPKNGVEGFSVDGIADETHGVATDYQIIFLSSGNIVKEAKVLSKHLNISAIQAYKILKKTTQKRLRRIPPSFISTNLKVGVGSARC